MKVSGFALVQSIPQIEQTAVLLLSLGERGRPGRERRSEAGPPDRIGMPQKYRESIPLPPGHPCDKDHRRCRRIAMGVSGQALEPTGRGIHKQDPVCTSPTGPYGFGVGVLAKSHREGPRGSRPASFNGECSGRGRNRIHNCRERMYDRGRHGAATMGSMTIRIPRLGDLFDHQARELSLERRGESKSWSSMLFRRRCRVASRSAPSCACRSATVT